MKFIILILVMAIFLVNWVEPCSDQFVKRMAVKACSLEKRSFSSGSDWSIFGLNFRNSDNIEPNPFTRLIKVVDEINELFLKKSNIKKSQESNVARFRPSHLSMNLDKTSHKIIPITESNGDDIRKSSVRKRQINLETLIRECCSRLCTIDDFRGICDKK